MILETNNNFGTENIGTELHLIGKLNFIKDPLSNKRFKLCIQIINNFINVTFDFYFAPFFNNI